MLLAFRLGTNILVFVTGNANNNTGKFDVPKCWMTFQIQIWDVKLTLLIIFLMFSPGGDRLQNNKMPLAVNNVIPLRIGPSKNAIMYHLGEGTRPCPFSIIANGHGRVTASGRQSLDLA